MSQIRIGNKIVSHKSELFTIAEIGINHNGSIKIAKKLIDKAKQAGFSAVKFQTYITDDLVLPNTGLVNYQKKNRFKDMRTLLQKYNFSFEIFAKLKKYCDRKKIIFLSTPFDIKSSIFLNSINIPAFKVSSGDFDNRLLIDQLKKFKKPIILSTGMTDLLDTKKILKIYKFKKNQLILLHCVSDYPTEIENSYLNNITRLKELGYIVGFSDHTEDNICASSSVFLGASLVEKHITLSNSMKGPDHKASLSIDKLSIFIKNLNLIRKSYLKKKRLLTNLEKQTKNKARKSLFYNKNLSEHSILRPDDIVALRSNTLGISPLYYKKILQRRLKKNVKKNARIKFIDLLNVKKN